MLVFDKQEIKEKITTEDIYQFCADFGGEPEYTNFGLISKTICHNNPFADSASRKLYYYENSGLLHCFSGCAEPSFDIFELIIKVFQLQNNKIIDLNEAIRYMANRLGIEGRLEEQPEEDPLPDWQVFSNYSRIQSIEIVQKKAITLKEYDSSILDRFNYSLRITPWLREGISQEVIEKAYIGFYPGGDQITIPHFDKESRFIGLRGRTLSQEEGELYGKYRPIKVNGILYNHPLSANLYGLDKAKTAIRKMGKAIIFESEKAVLHYASSFGWDNNISVACCGSNISAYQIQLLIDCGVDEIIIAFDRDWEEKGDSTFQHQKKNILKLNERFKNYVNISFIFDKEKITSLKSSPIDESSDKFLRLFKERIKL